MDDIEVKDIVKSVASMFINAINGINEIVAERDPNHRGANSKDFKLPPVVPQDLVLIRISEISAIVRSQKERLLARWTLEVIDLIEQEHGKTLDSLNGDSTLMNHGVVSKAGISIFNDSVVKLLLCFPFSQQYCQPFARGMLHCKQMKMLSLIVP
ncbi:hypothetical protein KXD40_008897 [Peronospora effusa]|nr:hypothetical protein KXD40_008897 [Peronospora effusa]